MGLWTIPIPHTTQAKKLKSGETLVGVLTQITQFQPTMMERWLLSGLWLPIRATSTAAKSSAAVEVRLAYGGDIIWNQSHAFAFVTGQIQAFGESFPVPIEIMRGRVLSLQALITNNAEEEQELTVITSPNTEPNGYLSYYSERLTGERVL